MIIKALCDFYDRKAAIGEVVPDGFESKNIPFVVLLKSDGKFSALLDTRDSPKDKGKFFTVPKDKIRTSAVVANILWGTSEYVLAEPRSDSPKDIASAEKKSAAFTEEVEKIAKAYPENVEFSAVLAFLKSPEQLALLKSIPEFALCKKVKGANVSFRMSGAENLVCENADVSSYIKQTEASRESTESTLCIVSGKRGTPVLVHRGFALGGKTGVKLVAFQITRGYDSYGKEQGLNAPICSETEFKYTTAMNMLLASGSGHRAGIGQTTVLFWGEKSSPFEDQISSFFGFAPTDNPEADSVKIRNLYKSVASGMEAHDGGGRFFVLGVEPNKSRMVVRFWHADSLSNIAANVRMYFDDLSIVRGKFDSELFSLFNILTQLSLKDKEENLPPRLKGDILRCAFTGCAFPRSVQFQCINRIRSERRAGRNKSNSLKASCNSKKSTASKPYVGRIRAALLKACLNRKNRIYNSNEKEITMALDTENTNIGYLCGRLFAALEKIQKDAQGEKKSNIVDRYYGSASSTPVAVFSRLIDLANHHFSKIQNAGIVVVRKKLLGEIFDKMPASGFPSHLDLDGQSRFAIGYYQQAQDFYKTNEK